MTDQQWHRYEDRKPTKADGNNHGYILACYTVKSGCTLIDVFSWDEPFSDFENAQWTRIPDPLPPKKAT